MSVKKERERVRRFVNKKREKKIDREKHEKTGRQRQREKEKYRKRKRRKRKRERERIFINEEERTLV